MLTSPRIFILIPLQFETMFSPRWLRPTSLHIDGILYNFPDDNEDEDILEGQTVVLLASGFRGSPCPVRAYHTEGAWVKFPPVTPAGARCPRHATYSHNMTTVTNKHDNLAPSLKGNLCRLVGETNSTINILIKHRTRHVSLETTANRTSFNLQIELLKCDSDLHRVRDFIDEFERR